MTSLDKAIEIHHFYDGNLINAIYCIDELIEAFKELSRQESGRVNIDFGHRFWEEVRNEIVNL